jgi:hypothetical protein
VDPKASLDDLEKRKCLTLQGLELRPFSRPAPASRYTDYATPTPKVRLYDGHFEGTGLGKWGKQSSVPSKAQVESVI